MSARAALGRALVATGGTIFALGAGTMLVSSVSMGVARTVIAQRKVKPLLIAAAVSAVACGVSPGAGVCTRAGW